MTRKRDGNDTDKGREDDLDFRSKYKSDKHCA